MGPVSTSWMRHDSAINIDEISPLGDGWPVGNALVQDACVVTPRATRPAARKWASRARGGGAICAKLVDKSL